MLSILLPPNDLEQHNKYKKSFNFLTFDVAINKNTCRIQASASFEHYYILGMAMEESEMITEQKNSKECLKRSLTECDTQ